MPEVARICREISHFLARKRPEQRLHLTLSGLRNQTRPKVDEDLLVAIQYLTGAEADLLEANFEYVEEGEYFPLSKAQMRGGLETISADLGVTFASAQDFESRVLIYFTPSERAREAMRRQEHA